MAYFLIENDTQCGPYTLEELSHKKIYQDTPVWTQGLDDWAKAKDIPMLKEILKTVPPAYKKAPPAIPIPTPPSYSNSTTAKYHGYNLATRWERFVAAFIGTLIILVPVSILTKGEYGAGDSYFSLFGFIVDTTIAVIIGGLMYPLWGGNIGHKIFGLKVISLKNGVDMKQPVNGIAREVLKNILGYFILPIIWLLWDEDKQNLYDKAMGTVVVKKKEE
ncbi:MAG: RDD family protein [Saprospiraceae bacterium]